MVDKVIITTEENAGLESPVCRRFGRSPYYIVATVDRGAVVDAKVCANHRFDGHQMGLLKTVCCEGASVLLAGGMEPRVCAMFNDIGVTVVSDLAGTAAEALDDFLLATAMGEDGRNYPAGSVLPVLRAGNSSKSPYLGGWGE